MLHYRWSVDVVFCFSYCMPWRHGDGTKSSAQTAHRRNGILAGVSAAPDQFYLGSNWMAAKVATNFWFLPALKWVLLKRADRLWESMERLSISLDIHRARGAPILGADQLMIDKLFTMTRPEQQHTVWPGVHFLLLEFESQRGFSRKSSRSDGSVPDFKFGLDIPSYR